MGGIPKKLMFISMLAAFGTPTLLALAGTGNEPAQKTIDEPAKA